MKTILTGAVAAGVLTVFSAAPAAAQPSPPSLPSPPSAGSVPVGGVIDAAFSGVASTVGSTNFVGIIAATGNVTDEEVRAAAGALGTTAQAASEAVQVAARELGSAAGGSQ